ncbi:putative metal-sulfur cluster biosynthetic enzyme [Opitutaceae bacterium TAV1]|nr:FeS assembly SUF system protein SufT [Opitutaceae bacterium TAV5]EIQ01818.1 putative metal-sulfur cluster biosynthetic enzyme [Opitutaceae bacterium TAV1]
MSATKDRNLTREIIATQIPSGDRQTLSAGTRVYLHQTLGGSFTVQTDFGLYRIDGKDGDALGEEILDDKVHAETLADGAPDPDAIWDQLKKVYDPEIPVNIVDLGLVYSMDVEKIEPVANAPAPAADPGYKVVVAMTLTAPGCGMGPAIAEDAKSKILLVPGVSAADVNITWEPPWSQEMITEEGKMKLGLI